MSTNPNPAGDLQNQYTNDWAAFLAAEQQEDADNKAYAAGLAGIAEMVKNHDSPDEILAVLMGLISGHGLSAQEDQVAVTSAEINVNSDLGAIANDMQNQLNKALSAQFSNPGSGMLAKDAAQMQADYKNLQTDIANQEAYLNKKNLPIPPALKSMQDALNDLNNQSGGLLANGTPAYLAAFYNTTVETYSQGGNNNTIIPNSPNSTGGALSSSFSDIATVKQQLGSLSTPLNAETQYETQQISTVETFITNLSKELAQLTKAFVTNENPQ